jgi:hypothetical protein
MQINTSQKWLTRPSLRLVTLSSASPERGDLEW